MSLIDDHHRLDTIQELILQMAVAASSGAKIDGSLSRKLMNLLMPVFSMKLAKKMSLQILSLFLLDSVVAAIVPDLEVLTASMGIEPLFLTEMILVLSVPDQLDVSFVDVGVALQCHAPTLNGFLLHVLRVASRWAHAPQSPF